MIGRVSKIVGGLVVTAGVLAAAPTAAQDPSRYCDREGAGGYAVFLIDVSDPYNTIDQERLAVGAANIFEKVPGGERLAVVLMGDRPEYLERRFLQCMPGCDKSKMGLFESLTTNACIDSRIREDRDKLLPQYRRAIAEILADKKRKEAKHTRILETLRNVSADFRSGSIHRLYIFSDMIENSAIARFSDLDGKKVEQYLAKVGDAGMIPNLKGTEVVVFGFGTPQGDAKRQGALANAVRSSLERFWATYFTMAGARLVNMSGDFNR
jgi:hypothetical protein